MKKLAFFVLYFGKLPKYFEYFIHSCGFNQNYDFIIYTDKKVEKFKEFLNIKFIQISFKDMTDRIQSKLNSDFPILTPHKLCDYKPMYGYIFEDQIVDYEYWGHCDIDIILGDLEKFLKKILNENYSKYFTLGHFTIYRNEKRTNRIFKWQNENINLSYTKALEKEETQLFDEGFVWKNNINSIFLKNNLKIFSEQFAADIYPKSGRFKLVNSNFEVSKENIIKYKRLLFIYDNGKVLMYFKKNNKIKYKEYMYIHLQKRYMKTKTKNFDYYKIIPNHFLDSPIISNSNYSWIRKNSINLHYLKIRIKNLRHKISLRLNK